MCGAYVQEGRLTIAATLAMQLIEISLASVAEKLASASDVLSSLSTRNKDNHNELQNSNFALESEAKKAMQQYLVDKGPADVTEDPSLCYIHRDAAHIQADTSRKKPKEFSFDAAFIVSKEGSGEIWVGEFKTKLTRDDVATANKKKQELQEYIDDASSDHSSEPEMFRRQAAQLKFLIGRPVYLIVGAAQFMSEAEVEIDKVSCIKLIANGAQFDVVEPSQP